MASRTMIRVYLALAAVLGLALARADDNPPAAPPAPATEPANAAGVPNLTDKLNGTLREFRLDGVPFERAIEQWRDLTRINVVVRWNRLEAAGVNRTLPITFRLFDLPARSALRVMLAAAGGGTVRLDFTEADDILTISTAEDIEQKGAVTRVYDVGDLFAATVRSTPAEGLPATKPNAIESAPWSFLGQNMSRQEVTDIIVRLIEEVVAPDTWRDAGGTVGAIQEVSGFLIITTTPEAHAKVTRLLGTLRTLARLRHAGKSPTVNGMDLFQTPDGSGR